MACDNGAEFQAQSHAFALNLEVVNGTMVMGTEVSPVSYSYSTSSSFSI